MTSPKIISKIKYTENVNFRFGKLGNEYLLTDDIGKWIFLSEKEFRLLIENRFSKKSALYEKLKENGFVSDKKNRLAEYASEYLRFNRSLLQGPSLFMFVVTLQCNHRCLYCQATPERRGATGFDMDKKSAKKSVDLMFRTTSNQVGIEFQGGEPLLNWPIVKYIIKYAKTLNKTERKDLKISIVTNLTLMDDEKLVYLLKEGVSISCSLDGPQYVHDKNRIYLDGKGGSHKPLVKNIKKVQAAINSEKAKHKDGFVDNINGILTVTRFSLAYPKEIVDEYRERGFNNLFIRQLSPFGLERQTLGLIGYSAEEFIAFYKQAMDYILEINLKGELFIERTTFIALKKILKNQDPAYYEMRSPCGAGIGQMAFNYDGKVFTCDEGRMAERMGYDNFQIGDVENSRYAEVIDNEVTRTMCLASSLENHAGCSDCVYKPYCGICPLANFIECGTIFPQIYNTDRHKINKAMFDYIFTKLKNPEYRKVFESWLI